MTNGLSVLKTDHSMTRDTTYVLKNSKSWVGLKKEQEKIS